MVKKEMIVKNTTGIHGFYAAKIAHLVSCFDSDVFIKKEDKIANCTSVMSLIGLYIKKDEKILILADGLDEEEALEALVKYLNKLSD